MTAAAMFLSAMHTLVRFVSDGMHPFQIAFFRNLFGLLAVVPFIVRDGIRSLHTNRPGLQLARGVSGLFAMLTWFYALSIVPLAEATALSFTAVIFSSVGAALILGEKMRLRRWTAVALGFVGALLILRPGFRALDIGLLLVIGSSMMWGTNVVIVKRLSRTDSVTSIVTIAALLLTILSFFPALYTWQSPTASQLLWLVAIGMLGTLGHVCMANALKRADTGAVMPLDFSRLVWASLLGFILFAEIPGIWTFVGGGIIVAAATYIIVRESRLSK